MQVSEQEIETYHRDGVVCLRSLFSPEWIAQLDRGLDRNLAAPTPRARVWDRDQDGRTMTWDSQAWMDVPEYQAFVEQSPAASIAGQLMRATSINFFFDAVFVRSAGTQFATPWHQDEPYWSVDGYDTCTIWMPLVPVKAANALAFVPGSHLIEDVFDHFDFGALNPDQKTTVDRSDFSSVATAPLPNIDDDPERFGVVSWDMEPGDCVVFNGRTMHGGSGRLPDDLDLRVFTSKWLGDDARIIFREQGMDPDHSAIITEYGLKPGDRPGTALYPRVWSAAIS